MVSDTSVQACKELWKVWIGLTGFSVIALHMQSFPYPKHTGDVH